MPLRAQSNLTVAQDIAARYEPLQESQIRLLKLHAGEPEDEIKTSLITVDLHNAPPYEALSYIWGDWDKRRTIQLIESTCDVTKNLLDALSNLRSPNAERLIWADAICVNQHDLHERNHQVSIMDKIYEGAKSVVIFLGEDTDQTEQAFRILRHFTDMNAEKEELPWSHAQLSDTEKSLQDIFGREWFNRIWTVQEATLARHTTLVCGNHQLSWDGNLQTLRSMVFRIQAHAISPYFSILSPQKSSLDWSPLLNILETQMRQAARREGVTLQRSLLDIAYNFRERRCMEPRDKFFAIFSMIENDKGERLRLQPDYTMRLEDVYDDFIREIHRIGEIEDVRSVSGS
jgi:hypothetical protein